MKTLNILTASFLGLMSISSFAATIDGSVTAGEYQWNTDSAAAGGSDKWNSKGSSPTEYNDASGGDRWDINYLGTNITGGKFQFGVVGGEIIDGGTTGTGGGQNITLSDFAISVNNYTDPTGSAGDASGFQYAIRLTGVDSQTGVASFALLTGGTWAETNIYNNANHISQAFKMQNASVLATFDGLWTDNGTTDEDVLEGEFDLSFLSAFMPSTGGTISTYLTMTCVNDEALVHANVSAVPVPAALFMFAPALAGFMGLRRRMKATA